VLRKLKVPPKVRIFWWRVIQIFLPSNVELARRHIREDSYYAACGSDLERLYHVIVECPWAKHFWSEVKKLAGRKLLVLHPITWATDLLQGSLCSLAMQLSLFVVVGLSGQAVTSVSMVGIGGIP
jgi:hypothetical protein